MKRTREHQIGRWHITFTNNVHMYCHDLSVRKGKLVIRIRCEDLPRPPKTIGIWLHDIDLSDKHREELRSAFLTWGEVMGVRCEVYT